MEPPPRYTLVDLMVLVGASGFAFAFNRTAAFAFFPDPAEFYILVLGGMLTCGGLGWRINRRRRLDQLTGFLIGLGGGPFGVIALALYREPRKTPPCDGPGSGPGR